MLTNEASDFLRTIADHAAASILGDAAGPGQHGLSDVLYERLCETVEDAYRRGVDTQMVQLSIVPELARAVG